MPFMVDCGAQIYLVIIEVSTVRNVGINDLLT